METKRQTAKALAGSIEKWRAIVEKRGVDEGVFNCPLCAIFYNDECEGCPVAKKTGEWWCEGSPHEAWELHGGRKHYEEIRESGVRENLCGTCTRLAKAELRFLEGLAND